MTAVYDGVLSTITRILGVRGAMVVSMDGLIVADALMEGIRGNAVAALAASLFKRCDQATAASRVGATRFFHLQAEDGTLLSLPAGDELLLVAVADGDVNVGLARLEMLRAAERL